jgi:nitrogen-specific signal transduction histidine kinase
MAPDRERSARAEDDDGSLSPSGAEPNVLLVGDADETAAALREAGFAVTRVAAETEATAEFDCLVVAADGVDVLSGLDSVHSAVPVVFVGGDAAGAAAAFEAGADEFVAAANAADPAVLGARVRGVLARATNTLLEADLARERSLLDAIFETVPAHLYVKDREGRHVRVSEAYVDDTDRFLGKTDYEVFPDESSRATYEDDVRIMETGEPLFDQEEPIVSSDTHKFSLRHLLEEHGDHGDVETATGSWVLTSKVPWRDEDGTVVGLVGFTVDISEQKAQRKRLERQNERLEEFAGIVSHDLRSPLNVAQGYLELLADSVDDDGQGHLERVEQAHRRMGRLIEDVLSLARQGTVVDSPDSTHVGDAARHAWQTAVTGTHATLRVETGDLTVEADAGRLYDLFGNLFANSVEHGTTDGRTAPDDGAERAAEDGHVTVRVGVLDGERGFFVEDDGPGIPAEDRDTVFETGYTTDADGTGFGLAIVRRIAEAHGWSASVTEAASGGARFEFRAESHAKSPFEDAGGPRLDRYVATDRSEGAGR